MSGHHLTRTEPRDAAIEALAGTAGGRVGLEGVLADLGSQARRSLAGRAVGRSIDSALVWERADARDPRWWPQGISSSADADDSGLVAGRRLLLVSWYAKEVAGEKHGARVTVLDLASRRYEHVLLVRAGDDGGLSPVHAHAGGIVWRGDHLHVAATKQGFVTFRLSDVVRHTRHGHWFVLPAWCDHRPGQDDGVDPLRYSFLSLDRSSSPAGPRLLVGEYARGGAPARLVSYALDDAGLPVLDDGGRARATDLGTGVRQMQGVAATPAGLVATVSRGPWLPGSAVAAPEGSARVRRWAAPMGPEDLSWWPDGRGGGRLWSVSEHPRRRWVVSLRPHPAGRRA